MRFTVTDARTDLHVPLLVSALAYSTYRGSWTAAQLRT